MFSVTLITLHSKRIVSFFLQYTVILDQFTQIRCSIKINNDNNSKTTAAKTAVRTTATATTTTTTYQYDYDFHRKHYRRHREIVSYIA